MTGFSLIPHHNSSHIRTTSDPPTPHPIVIKLEEELHKLKSTLTSSPSPNAQILHNALRELSSLYNSIDELLHLQTTQQSLTQSHHKKWVEEQLDSSIKFLDLIYSTKDCMVSMKDHVRDLRWPIRKRGGDACETSQKKLHRDMRGCLRLLKQIESGACSSFVKDWDVMMMDRVMVKLKEIVVAVLRSMMRMKVGESKDQLRELESNVEGFENELELLFRRMITNRVILLNILSL